MNEPTEVLGRALAEKLRPEVETLRSKGWKADLMWRRDDNGRVSFGIDVELEPATPPSQGMCPYCGKPAHIEWCDAKLRPTPTS